MQEKIALKGKEKGGGGDKQALFYTDSWPFEQLGVIVKGNTTDADLPLRGVVTDQKPPWEEAGLPGRMRQAHQTRPCRARATVKHCAPRGNIELG